MSKGKGFKRELAEVDASIARIKGWIAAGQPMQHFLNIFEDRRMKIVNRIGRKK